jgi:hypothetical protein
MKIASVLSRYRLPVNVLALALALSTLALSPVAAQDDGIICDEGCVAWDIENGCTRMLSCCVRSPDDWACAEWSPVN